MGKTTKSEEQVLIAATVYADYVKEKASADLIANAHRALLTAVYHMRQNKQLTFDFAASQTIGTSDVR